MFWLSFRCTNISQLFLIITFFDKKFTSKERCIQHFGREEGNEEILWKLDVKEDYLNLFLLSRLLDETVTLDTVWC
jgi:hypothetical protein